MTSLRHFLMRTTALTLVLLVVPEWPPVRRHTAKRSLS